MSSRDPMGAFVFIPIAIVIAIIGAFTIEFPDYPQNKKNQPIKQERRLKRTRIIADSTYNQFTLPKDYNNPLSYNLIYNPDSSRNSTNSLDLTRHIGPEMK
ncbi:MAG: hypothetical protein KKF48_03445 [Nanoarchaeota archaeon]|nr:hypothetical protein [Nanoarchaeota archaeon]MBU1028074.1 hypothetical protein [Nanoarchaeota archaeon]